MYTAAAIPRGGLFLSERESSSTSPPTRCVQFCVEVINVRDLQNCGNKYSKVCSVLKAGVHKCSKTLGITSKF